MKSFFLVACMSLFIFGCAENKQHDDKNKSCYMVENPQPSINCTPPGSDAKGK